MNGVQEGDFVRVHMGNVIPFDGMVTEGEAMVNQASSPEKRCRSANVRAAMFTPVQWWKKEKSPFR